MYIHLGGDMVVPKSSVIGIFDLDNATVSRFTRDYLETAEREGRLINISDNLPKGFIVTAEKNCEKDKVYLSQISSATLRKRWYEDPQ